MNPTTQPTFAALLATATTEPGTINAAYTAFHGYSFGNQVLAAMQCMDREIPLGPIATFQRWKELGRFVTKGSKAIELCMPVTGKRTVDTPEGEETVGYTRFIFRRNWFVLAQTDGADYVAPPVPGWEQTRALEALDVALVPFQHLDGNCQGYAKGREIAINPVAALPVKTTFHELAHVLIGHTAEGQMNDSDRTPRDIRELEAEATAMLCCAALDLPGVDDTRGYIQAWVGSGAEIPEASARRIFKAADQILKAGRPAVVTEGA